MDLKDEGKFIFPGDSLFNTTPWGIKSSTGEDSEETHGYNYKG
jgi:hypothetical protein